MQNIVDNPQSDMEWALSLVGDRGLGGKIATQVRRAIIEGTLPAGQKINEEQLSEAFATSRTPVREALRLLEAEGLVTVVPRRGAWVSQLVPEEAADVHLCRSYLLGLACKLAAIRGTGDDHAALFSLLDELRRFTEADNWLDYVSVMAAVNDRIVDAAGSPHIKEALRPLNAKAQRYRHISASLMGRRADSLRNYETVLTAIRERRALDAEQAMRHAVAEAGEALLQHIVQGGAGRDLTIKGYL